MHIDKGWGGGSADHRLQHTVWLGPWVYGLPLATKASALGPGGALLKTGDSLAKARPEVRKYVV